MIFMFLPLADSFAKGKEEFKSSCVVFPLLVAFFLTKPGGHSGFLCTDICSVASAAGYGAFLALQALACTLFVLEKSSAPITGSICI